MTLQSMTGFARGSGNTNGHSWNWEIKSVNNKGLDVRVKLPSFLDGFDLTLKKTVASKLTRGSVFVSLSIESEEDNSQFIVHEERLKSLLSVASKFSGAPGVGEASLDGLLAIKGVVDLMSSELSEDERTSLEDALLISFRNVVNDLIATRAGEGARMAEVLSSQLKEVTVLANIARETSGDRIETMHERFRQQLLKLENVAKPVPDDKLAHEIATMAVKADVQEELDRLDCHILEAEKLLASGKPVGRRLDFLCQEFNREANTLCSKASDSKLTKIGLDLKAVIDQFREQIQNIE